MFRTLALVTFASIILACSSTATSPEPQPTEDPSTASQGSQAGAGNGTGGQDARSTTSNPTPRAFGATCTTGADCDSGVCFAGGKGGFCSGKCTADTDCPQPSSGAPHCNPHGYCRY